MWLLQDGWKVLRPDWRRYLTLNGLIYGGVVVGFALGWAGHLRVEAGLMPRLVLAQGGLGPGWFIWLAQHWLLLAGGFMAVNLALVSLAILAGAAWPPALILLGGWFGLELVFVTAVYVTLEPWSLVPLLPLLVVEAQAVVLGLFAGWGLGARKGAWRQRLGAWSVYWPVCRLIPPLLLVAGLWEARIISALVEVTGG